MSALDIALVVGFTLIALAFAWAWLRLLDRYFPMEEGE